MNYPLFFLTLAVGFIAFATVNRLWEGLGGEVTPIMVIMAAIVVMIMALILGYA